MSLPESRLVRNPDHFEAQRNYYGQFTQLLASKGFPDADNVAASMESVGYEPVLHVRKPVLPQRLQDTIDTFYGDSVYAAEISFSPKTVIVSFDSDFHEQIWGLTYFFIPAEKDVPEHAKENKLIFNIEQMEVSFRTADPNRPLIDRYDRNDQSTRNTGELPVEVTRDLVTLLEQFTEMKKGALTIEELNGETRKKIPQVEPHMLQEHN